MLADSVYIQTDFISRDDLLYSTLDPFGMGDSLAGDRIGIRFQEGRDADLDHGRLFISCLFRHGYQSPPYHLPTLYCIFVSISIQVSEHFVLHELRCC